MLHYNNLRMRLHVFMFDGAFGRYYRHIGSDIFEQSKGYCQYSCSESTKNSMLKVVQRGKHLQKMPFRKTKIKKSLQYTAPQMKIAKYWKAGKTDKQMSNLGYIVSFLFLYISLATILAATVGVVYQHSCRLIVYCGQSLP